MHLFLSARLSTASDAHGGERGEGRERRFGKLGNLCQDKMMSELSELTLTHTIYFPTVQKEILERKVWKARTAFHLVQSFRVF